MMGQLKIRRIAPVILVGGLLGIAVIAGCHKAKPVAATNPPAPPGPIAAGAGAATQATGGRGVFEANCMRCHPTGGPAAGPASGGKGMMKGPDLAKVGQDPMHTRDWIMAYVRDPKVQNPMSRMPKFGDRLAEADLRSRLSSEPERQEAVSGRSFAKTPPLTRTSPLIFSPFRPVCT